VVVVLILDRNRYCPLALEGGVFWSVTPLVANSTDQATVQATDQATGKLLLFCMT